MKVRILNEDGIQSHTKVLDADTGEELQYVSGIDVHHVRARYDRILLSLEIESGILDLVGYAEFYTHCPHCGERIQGVGNWKDCQK